MEKEKYTVECVIPMEGAIKNLENRPNIYILYLGDMTMDDAPVLKYLNEAIDAERFLLYLIGNKDELTLALMYIGKEKIQETYLRPLDVKLLSEQLDTVFDYSEIDENLKKKILIIDDDGAMLRMMRTWLSVKYHVYMASSGKIALSFLAKNPIDLVLLDYEMPGMNGMETAKALRKMDAAVILIFVTNLTQYAIMGYEVDALSYILKPVNRFDFALKMSKAIARTAKRGEESVVIKTVRETHSVRIAAIQYVEADGHNMVYHTTEGVFSEYGTLKDTEKKLNKDYFVRCNRCFLVNMRFVASVKEDTVFIGQDALQISRSQKKAFLNALTVYIGGVKG